MNFNNKLEDICNLKKELFYLKKKLLNYTKNNNKLIRADAIEVLSELYDANVDKVFIKGLKDKSYLVRINALEAISMPHDAEKVFAEIAKSLKDENWLVRAYAIEALANNNANMYKEKILKMIKKAENNAEKVRIYYALIKFGEENYLNELLKMFQCKDYSVRCAVANSLYCLDNKERHESIIRALKKALKYENTKGGKSCIQGAIKDILSLT